MKRSAQVALLAGGLTAAGAGAYAMMPSGRNCAPQNPASHGATAPGLTAPAPTPVPAVPPVAAAAAGAAGAQPCEPRRGWFTGSGYRSGNSYYRSRPIWDSSKSRSRTSSSTSVAVGSRTGSSTSSSSSRSSFGGFGRTGSSYSRSS